MIDLIVQVFRSPRIKTTTHLAVALAIARRCGDEHGVCFAKQSTLAADSRLHQKTVGTAITQLEAEGLIRRVRQEPTEDGRRLPDHLYLTLDAVTLPATGQPKTGSPARSPGSPVSKARESSAPKPGSQGLPNKRPDEETKEEDAQERDSHGDSDQVNLALATKLIWQAFQPGGRNRSSLEDVRDHLEKAIRRRPKGQTAEERLERIMSGLKAYLATPDARKEQGSFQRGPHRLLIKDRWQSFLTDADGRDEADQPPVDPEMGTLEKPGPKLQRHWAELAAQGMPWDSSRGPRPGMPGCRISPEIQTAFGFMPYLEGEAAERRAAQEAERQAFLRNETGPAATAAEDDDDSAAFA